LARVIETKGRHRDIVAMKGSKTLPKELMDTLVLSIVTFMNKAGMKPQQIDESFRAAIGGLEASHQSPEKNASKGATGIGCDTIAGAVLRAWHRDPSYLDDFANPIPLALQGSRRSLATLVRSQDCEADFSGLISAMVRTGLIKKSKDKRYLPTTSAATISQMHPFAVDHVVKTVLRLVETVTRNMHPVQSQPALVERYAHIPDLDAKEARAFSDFTRQQGAACLEAIEDWLEARRKERPRTGSGRQQAISAGMHVFAYLEQPIKQEKRRSRARNRSATSSRAAHA
jgi:hypothetical protein